MKTEIKPFLADGKTHRCCGTIWSGWDFTPCGSRASKHHKAGIFRNNIAGWFCGTQ